MRENDITGKCVSALVAIALLAGLSVLASRWIASAGADRAVPLPAPAPAAAAPSSPASAVRSAPRAAAPAPVSPSPVRADFPEREQLERQAFRLEMENARLRGRLDDMIAWILDNVRGTFPLPEAQMAHLRLSPVDPDMAVTADLAELLRLNDEEVDRLDAAFMGTRAVLQEIEVENISVDTPDETRTVLNIPPYAEDGQIVREELFGELQRTLGAARFDRFLQVAGPGLDEKFEHFGEVDRTLFFEIVLDAVSGDSRLFVRDERVLPAKDDPLRQDISASERILTELPAEYDPYREWLPDSVTRFSRSR
jgi:hypothetical protein